MKSGSFPVQNSIMHFLDLGQGTLLTDDCCNVIPFKQVVGGLNYSILPAFLEKKEIFHKSKGSGNAIVS